MSEPNAHYGGTNAILEDLRTLVKDKQVVVVVGTGVSVGATEGAEAASWTGLLKSGIVRCVDLGMRNEVWAEHRRADLYSGDLTDLLSVAEQVSSRLGAPNGGEYRKWLRESVGTLRVQNDAVLGALKSLEVPIVTTNYDGLIEEITGLAPVTWRESARVERVLRGNESGVMHLHGYWDDPESVVLGIRSYESVLGHQHAQAIQQSLRMSKSLLYIGFGTGLEDPNFGTLLRWTRDVFPDSEFRSYRLARTSELAKIREKHPQDERIVVISYGEKHEDLAPFLLSLGGVSSVPEPGTANEAIPAHSGFRKLWNVPHERNSDFTGRDTLLDALENSLKAESSAAVVQATGVVHGLGGVGKTQLVVEYAHRHASEYDIVWWVRAEEVTTLTSDFAALADDLGIFHQEPDQTIAVAAVRQWLERKDCQWLLIFDNVEQHRDLAGFLPKGGGHVLVTSRSREWPRTVKMIDVGVLEIDDAVRFLTTRTGKDDESVARELANELGCLPLALEQAGAYIEHRNLTLSGYLGRFRTHKSDLLSRGKPEDYPYTVATTWEISLQAAAELMPSTEALMNLVAFMAPDAVPLELIFSRESFLSDIISTELSNPIELDDAITVLRNFSMVEAVDDTLSIHRLVQFVAQNRMTRDVKQTWVALALTLVNAAFPDEAHDIREWPDASRLLPHGLAISQFAEEMEVDRATTGQLLNRIGRYLTGRAQFSQAHQVLERALTVREAALGASHPDVARDLNDLSVVLSDLGDLAGARERHERALSIQETSLGADHPDVATSLNNLGSVLSKQGDLAGAQERNERALSIRETALGPDHPDVATSLNNLGSVLSKQGDLAGARERYERALSIQETALGADHPDVATSLNNLGYVLSEQGDQAGARERYERALSIRETALGPDHPDVATILNNLGSVLSEQGDQAGARERYERALSIRETALGPNHPDVAMSLNNLGYVLSKQGDLAGARERHDRALSIQETALGADHPDVATSLNNLGSVLSKQGDLAGARERNERALSIRETALGADHPDVAMSLNNLGSVLSEQGDQAGAQERYERALSIRETALGPDHPDVATILNNLGSVLSEQGDQAGARERNERALSIRETALGADHPDVAMSLNNLGYVLSKQGDLAGARERHDRALSIRETALGADHPDVAMSLNNLGSVLSEQGDQAGARERYERALSIAERNGRQSSVADTRRLLASLDRKQGRLSAAGSHLRISLRIDQDLGQRSAEAADFLGLANLAAVAGFGSSRRHMLIIHWLILRDLGFPNAKSARRSAENAFPPVQRSKFEDRANEVERTYRRDGGRGAVEQMLKKLY